MDQFDSQLKELAETGVFGSGRFSYLKTKSNTEEFLYPDISYYDIGLDGSQPKTYQLTIKTQQRPEVVRRIMQTDKLFSNEIAMYKVILPFLKADKLAPRLFYGQATLGGDASKDVLILEDARAQGFTKTKALNLDYEETMVAMKNLGKFHGCSYLVKNLHPFIFSCLTPTLHPVIPGDGNWDIALHCALERGIQPLMNSPENRKLLDQVLNKLNDPREAMRNLRTPNEPYAVIYHGDFNKENILFKYDDKGNATDCVFLDFQMSLYCDPSIDITYLLYMNVPADLRDKHWDEFLKSYWDGVTGIEPNPGFGFDQFLENFSKKAIYGYFPSSIFLTRALSTDPRGDSTEQLNNLSVEDRAKKVASMGGSGATTLLTKIVKHLLDKGYLEKYVQSEF